MTNINVCYFVSQYPAVPHTFIRREITELEKNNVSVFRVSVRRNTGKLVDEADLQEKERTTYLSDQGIVELIRALAFALMRRPNALFKAALCATRMMRRSSRPRRYHLVYLIEAIVLARWTLARGVDHIHSHFGTNGAEVAMLCHLLTGIPYSFTVHGPDEFDRPEYLGLPEKVKHAAFICAVSSFTKSQLCRWVPASEWTKIKLVRCGLPANFVDQLPPTKISPHNLITVGRLAEQKGQLVLLSALATLSRRGVSFKMTIAGDGLLRPMLQRRIRELGLDEQVEMTGWLSNSEVRARILDARAVVLPSFAEGLPVVVMESLALERPVITTYVAGTPELVTDAVCGWLVPAGSTDQLACAIKKCLSAPDTLIQAMGRAGRERVLRRHDIGRECRKLAVLFRSTKEAKLPFENPHRGGLPGESNTPSSSVSEQTRVHRPNSAEETLGA